MKKKKNHLANLKTKISQTTNILERGKLPDKRALIKLLNGINSLSIDPVLQSEALFRTTLYSLRDAVITTDKKGRVQQMNPVAERLCGWKEADAKNKPFEFVFNIIDAVTRKEIKNFVSKVLKGGHTSVMANRTLLISKNDKEIPIADSSAPIKNDKGEVTGVVLVFRDQVKERENQNALEERERTFSTLVSNLPGFVYRCANDTNWTMEFISDGCKQITGYSPKDFINNKKLAFNDIILPSYQKTIWKQWQKLLKSKTYFEEEYPIKSKSGKIRWVWERGRGVFSKNGKLLFLEGFITDITARRNAEDLIAESEQRYKSLFNSSPDAIFLADPKTGKIIDANHVALNLIGMPLSKVIGMRQFQLHPKRLRTFSSKTFKKHSQNIDTKIPVENFLVAANGEEIPIEVLASIITMNGKDIIQGVFRNISERKRIEKELHESEHKFRSLFEHSKDAMLLLDDKVFFDCNKAAMEMMGCTSKEQMLSLHPSELSPELQPDGITSSIKADSIIKSAFKNGAERFEWIHRKLSGEDFPVEVMLTSIPLGGKQILFTVWRDITERKKTEEALRESEEKFRLMTEQTSDVVFITDANGIITYLSPASKNVFGFEVPQLIGLNFKELLAPEYIETALKAFRDVIEKGIKAQNLELLIKRKDGLLFFGELNGSRFKSGNFSGTSGTIRDISGRKAIESELQKSKDRMQILVEGTPHLFFYVQNLEGLVEYVSPSIENITGYPVEQWLNQNHWFITDSTINQVAKDRTHAHLRGEVNTDPVYVEILHSNGSKLMLEVYERPIFNEGKVVGLQGVAHNITEKRKAEQLLRESEERYRLIAENTADTISIFDMNLNFTYVSPSIKKLLGYTPEELISMGPSKVLAEDEYNEFINIFNEEIKNEKSGNADPNRVRIIQAQQLRKDGLTIWVERTVSFLRDNYGKPIGILTVSRDITSRKLIEEALTISEERYRTISNLTTDYLFSTQVDEKGVHKVVWIAGSFEKITGYTIDEYKKMGGWRAILHPDELELDDLDLKKLKKNKKVVREIRTYHKDGSLVWVKSLAQPIWDNKNNKLLGVYGAVEDITKRRLAEETLRESEQRYHSFINSHVDMMFVKDENLRYIVVNDATLKFFNKPREELLYKTDFELMDEESAKNFKISDLKALETNSVVISEEFSANKIFESTKFPLTLKSNKIGLGGIIRDITERKRSEIIQKIQYNIADAAVTYKTLTELFEIIRIELSSIINVNNFFIALYNEKTGMLKSDIDKDEMEEISEWPAKNSMTGYVIEKQKSVLLKKGEINRMIASGEAGMVGVIPEVWLGVPFKIGGKVFGVLVVQSYDNPNAYDQTSVEILEIVAHELSIYINHKKAEEETLKLSTAIVQSPIIVVITDPNGNIEFVNPKFSEVTGYSIEEVKGNTCRILKSGFHNKEFYSKLWETILSGKIWQGEFQNKKINGELYWENALISPLKDMEGNITHFVAVKEDVTSKKKMIQELIEAKEKAEEMNRIKSSFFANMSHELRTPMVGILGFSEVLISELKDNPDYSHMIRSINKSGQRLLETLNLILSLSKLEASKIEANLKPQNIIPILKETFNFFQSAAANKGLSYKFIVEKDELLCEIDQLLFISVFNNLLNNAIKFTDAGGITLSITADSGSAIISVTDTGVGISEEKQSVIWDEFRQASEGYNRSFEGTGLGLTIAKKYSNLMKGTISVKSTLGEGTTFMVRFPLTQGPSDSAEQNVSDSNPESTDSTQKEPAIKILYIEDDEIAIKYVTTITKGFYIVDSAKNSDEALAKVKQNIYDAILMDINLRRGMDGIELTGLIRKMENYKSIPIIAVTAFAMGKEKEEFLKRGMTHYLSKPFVKNQLLHLLKNVINKE